MDVAAATAFRFRSMFGLWLRPSHVVFSFGLISFLLSYAYCVLLECALFHADSVVYQSGVHRTAGVWSLNAYPAWM